MIYLDYNATAPMRPEVWDAMREAMLVPSNPSSMHAVGRKARQRLEAARETVAHAVGVWPNEVLFTASGTEANNTVLRGFPDRPLLVGATEHPSILKLALKLGGDVLPVDGQGFIDSGILESKLKALGRPALVSVMLANNETGIIQPIARLSQAARQYEALFHTDAVQAVGKIPFDMGTLQVDMMSLSAHKSGGPVGIGALVLRNDLPIKPFLVGGGQERSQRAGTEAVGLAAGFAKAMEMAQTREWTASIESEMRSLENNIKQNVVGAEVAGEGGIRLPNTSCLLIPGVVSETQLMHFDLEGFCVSAGSACSSGRIEPSPVLRAMGIAEAQAACAIRVSAGWNTKPEEIRAFGESWVKLAQRLGKQAV